MPITVTICSGPTCSSIGSRSITATVEKLARRFPGQILVNPQPCFSRCQLDEPGLCPSVRIGDEWCHRADETSVKRHLKALLQAPGLRRST